jgi:hypothetical protein
MVCQFSALKSGTTSHERMDAFTIFSNFGLIVGQENFAAADPGNWCAKRLRAADAAGARQLAAAAADTRRALDARRLG